MGMVIRGLSEHGGKVTTSSIFSFRRNGLVPPHRPRARGSDELHQKVAELRKHLLQQQAAAHACEKTASLLGSLPPPVFM